jgi:hypothetical protein
MLVIAGVLCNIESAGFRTIEGHCNSRRNRDEFRNTRESFRW